MKAGLKQRQVAGLIGTTRGLYSMLENGQRHCNTQHINNIARVTGGETLDLLREYEIWRALRP